MKKLTLILAAVVMGFLMTACNGNTDEKVKQATDAFFAQAEERVQAIDNIDDFMEFWNAFSEERDDFANEVAQPYVKGDDVDIPQEVYDYVFDRATAYNRVESAKCTEILTPLVDKYQACIESFYERYLAGERFDLETMFENEDPELMQLADAEEEVLKIGDYDNIEQGLADRIGDLFNKAQTMFTIEEQ